jgi:hypothetical protein
VPTQNAPCHSPAVNTVLHRFCRDRCPLPRSRYMKLRGYGDSNPTAPTINISLPHSHLRVAVILLWSKFRPDQPDVKVTRLIPNRASS